MAITIFNKIIGRDKFTSEGLPCPHCLAHKAKFIEALSFGVSRWRCGACKGTWRYLKTDSPPPDMADLQNNPSLLLGAPGVVRQHISIIKRFKRVRPPIVG